METTPSNSDEIDLLQLLARVSRFFLQNWLIIVLSTVGCLTASYLVYRGAPQIYESRMLVQSKFLTESYAIQVVKDLQKLISESADSAVARRLNVTPQAAASLNNISTESALGDRFNIPEDEKVVFAIVVETSDPATLPIIQQGLVSFFENNEFIKSRVNEKRKSYQGLLRQIDKEISDLEEGTSRKMGGGTLYPRRMENLKADTRTPNQVLFDPSAMTVFIYKDKIDTEEKLALLKGLEIIHGFSPSTRPIKPKLSIYLASGFSTGIVLTLVLLGFRSMQLLFKKYPA